MSRVGLGRHGKIDENAGDPLDGLVNLFDIGIVLAVAFLIAGLTLTVNPSSGRIERRCRRGARPGPRPRRRPAAAASAQRPRRSPVGTAYRLADGRLVIVSPRRSPSAAGVAGVEAFAVGAQEGRRQRPVVGAVAGGGGEPADQVRVDAVGVLGAAFGGAEQVAELQVGVATRFGTAPRR